MMKHSSLLKSSAAVALAAGLLLSLSVLATQARPATDVLAPSGNTWTVGGPCGTTIQACINYAANGDTVLVPFGTYVEFVRINHPVSLIGVSANGVRPTIKAPSTAGNIDPVVMIWSTNPMPAIGASTIISNLVITGGWSAIDVGSPSGGGLGISGERCAPTIQNVILSGNSGFGVGGLSIVQGPSPQLINLEIKNNTANFSSGWSGGGGGISIWGGAPELINSVVFGNQDLATGSQIFVRPSPLYGSSLRLRQVTIADAIVRATGLYAFNAAVAMTNTIIARQSIGLSVVNSTLTGDYNLYYGNNNDLINGGAHGPHDVSGDPAFVNPTGGDYHLRSISAARDTGTNAGSTVDFDGDPRPQNVFGGSGYDIGYDEFKPVALPASVCVTETHGLLANGGWQTSVNQPSFTWPAVPNAEGYKVVYHDTATHVLTTTTTASTLPALPAGYAVDLFVEPHYLADPGVNNTPGACLFTVRYDNTPPVIPARTAFTANFPDDAWISTSLTPVITASAQSVHDGWFDSFTDSCTATPPFTHACESGAGLKEERTYFGADPNGVPTTVWGPVQTWPLLSVTSGVYTFRLNATDNLNQASAAQTVRVLKLDTLAPTVVLTYTGSNPSMQNTQLPLQWNGTDTLSGIAAYDILVNGSPWLTNTTALSAIYPGTCQSTYQFIARARDAAGNLGVSALQTVSIVCDTIPPTVTMNAPAAGVVITGSSVAITGVAADASGLQKVEVSTDGGATWTTAAGTTSWNANWPVPLEDGVTHRLLARATDLSGNVQTTLPVTVTIDRVAPQASILDPLPNQTIRTRAYTLTGKANDGSGVSRVRVSTDNGVTYTDVPWNNGLWSFNWNIPVEDGVNHTLRVIAVDFAGNSTTSSNVPVLVDNVSPTISFNNLPVNSTTTIYTNTFTVIGTSSGASNTTLDLGNGAQSVPVVNTLFTRTWSSLITGTYTLRGMAQDAAGNSSAVTTTIVIKPAGPGLRKVWLPLVFRNFDPWRDRYEEDTPYSAAPSILSDGSIQHRSFYPADDVDWARLDVPAGTYIINTSGLAANTDTVLRLYASNGVTKLAENDDCTLYTRASCLTWTTSATTTLYIQIAPYNAQSIGSDRWYDLAVVRP